MYKKIKKNTDLRTINSLFKSLSKSIKKVDHQIIKNIQDEERLITLAASLKKRQAPLTSMVKYIRHM